MKRIVCGVLSSFVMTVMLGVPALQAQSNVIADVPFDFCVGQKSMAAGNYQVQSISEQIDMVRNLDATTATYVIKSVRVQAMKVPNAKLIFNKYGNQYFLSQIWDGNSNIGIQLPKSKREAEISLADKRISDGPEIVTVAMK